MTGEVATWDAGGYELAECARLVDGRLKFVDILSGACFEPPPRQA